MPLTEFHCWHSVVSDLAPLKDVPLKKISGDFQAPGDAKILRAIETPETINDKPAAQFWKEVEGQSKDQ